MTDKLTRTKLEEGRTKSKKISITSDGMGRTAKVLLSNGDDISELITNVDISIPMGGAVTAKLDTFLSSLSIEAAPDWSRVVRGIYHTLGSHAWLDSLTDGEWKAIDDFVVPVLMKQKEIRDKNNGS